MELTERVVFVTVGGVGAGAGAGVGELLPEFGVDEAEEEPEDELLEVLVGFVWLPVEEPPDELA